MMKGQLDLPAKVWERLNTAWALFFIAMGTLNLWVAFNFTTATWAKFKLFGIMGLMIAFALAQAVYLNRYMTPESDKDAP